MTIINVDFTRPNELKPVFTIESSGPNDVFCFQHPRVLIDEHTRVLSCQKCGKVIDPYDYVLLWAGKETALFSNIKQLTNEQNRLELASTALKKEVQTLKAQIKRLKEKAGSLEGNNSQVVSDKRTAKDCLSEIKGALK